jgi:integrase
VLSYLPEYLQDYCLFGFLSGWRRGEISVIAWEDVEDGTVRLAGEHSKNGEPRTIPIVGELEEVMERRKVARAVTTTTGEVMLADLVFHRQGKAIGDNRKAWQTACVAAGVGKFVCRHCIQPTKGHTCESCGTDDARYVGKLVHDLRRSAVRNMVRAGVHEKEAMSISGHKTRSMFDRYNIVSQDDQRDALMRTEAYRISQRKKQPTIITNAAKKLVEA